MNRIKDKINEIDKYLHEIGSILPLEFEEYKNDFKIKAICERYFEKIIEAIIDLTFLTIKEKNFKTPESDKEAFDILTKNKIITEDLSEKLKDAKGMRNILVHEYGKVEDELVFEAVTEQLIPDIEEFIKSIEDNI